MGLHDFGLPLSIFLTGSCPSASLESERATGTKLISCPVSRRGSLSCAQNFSFHMSYFGGQARNSISSPAAGSCVLSKILAALPLASLETSETSLLPYLWFRLLTSSIFKIFEAAEVFQQAVKMSFTKNKSSN